MLHELGDHTAHSPFSFKWTLSDLLVKVSDEPGLVDERKFFHTLHPKLGRHIQRSFL